MDVWELIKDGQLAIEHVVNDQITHQIEKLAIISYMLSDEQDGISQALKDVRNDLIRIRGVLYGIGKVYMK